MSTATITIKTRSDVKEKAEQIAEEKGISLSAIINQYLKMLVNMSTRRDKKEVPNRHLLKSLKKSDEAIKAGKTIAFKDEKSALDYINSLILHDKELRMHKLEAYR